MTYGVESTNYVYFIQLERIEVDDVIVIDDKNVYD